MPDADGLAEISTEEMLAEPAPEPKRPDAS
jgi:hypothetical protein